MFTGSLVALVTPMRADGALDEAALAGFVEWQIGQGTNGLVPVGTTGESPTLSHAEHKRVVEITIEAARRRVPVIAGAGSNSTAEAIDLTRHAKHAGADAALVVTPYYNKPTQEGLYLHFTAIADAVDLPIIIYNIPLAQRGRYERRDDGAAGAAQEHRRREGRDRQPRPPAAHAPRLRRGVLPALRRGPHRARLPRRRRRTAASASPPTWPRASAPRCTTPGATGGVRDAMGIQTRLLPLHDALFAETSPAPVKFAASLLGHTSEHCRLPLAPIAPATRERVRAAMTDAGLLN